MPDFKTGFDFLWISAYNQHVVFGWGSLFLCGKTWSLSPFYTKSFIWNLAHSGGFSLPRSSSLRNNPCFPDYFLRLRLLLLPRSFSLIERVSVPLSPSAYLAERDFYPHPLCGFPPGEGAYINPIITPSDILHRGLYRLLPIISTIYTTLLCCHTSEVAKEPESNILVSTHEG